MSLTISGLFSYRNISKNSNLALRKQKTTLFFINMDQLKIVAEENLGIIVEEIAEDINISQITVYLLSVILIQLEGNKLEN